MSKFYLEKDGPKRDQRATERELRTQLAAMLPYSSFKGKVAPETERIEVLQAIAPAIHAQFREHAAAKGELIAEEYQDAQGRTCRKFHGDSRSGLAPFSEGGARVRLAEVSHFEGKAYLKGKEPLGVKRAMLLRSRGLE